jgi:hypothetical protein
MGSLLARPVAWDMGIRWLARLLAALLVGIVVLFFVGTGGFNPWQLSTIEAVLMAFFAMACLGLVIAWRWEMLGGILATAGILLFFATEFAVRGRWPNGWPFYLMLVPGLLFLLSGFLKERRSFPTNPNLS